MRVRSPLDLPASNLCEMLMGRMCGNIYKDLIWSVTLMSKAGETLDPEDCIKLLEKHCKFLKPSDTSYSDFVFTNVLDAIGMVSFIDPAFILLNERYGLKIQDVGAGDVSPKFENKFFIVKYYREGVVPEYVLQTQTESLIRLASSGVRIPPYTIEQYERLRKMAKQRTIYFNESIPIDVALSTVFDNFPEFLKRGWHLIIDERKVERALEKRSEHVFVVLPYHRLGEESFFEYLGGLHFKEEGYFVTRWNSAGGADFFAYKIPDYLKVLKKHGVVKDGAFLAELELFPLVRFRDEKTSIYTDGKYDIAVCEAEARVNLAIRSNTGIGQKIGWADEHHSVYGVGPTNYKPEPKHIHEFFGENAGAIVFTTDTYDKLVVKPLKSEFTAEIDEITAMKHLIKSIFVNRLLINKKFERFTDIVHYIEVTPLEHVLENLLNAT